jgi:hypothetical protein
MKAAAPFISLNPPVGGSHNAMISDELTIRSAAGSSFSQSASAAK